MAKKKIGEYISDWLEEFGTENGYELSRSEFVKEGGSWYLRVYVDKLENGQYGTMGTDDCEKVSRFLSAKLDEEDPISQNYVLEVSSPGMDRLLVSDKDFVRFSGEIVDVNLYKAYNGTKTLTAKLKEKTEDTVILIDEKENEIVLPMDQVAKIRLAVIF